MNFLVDAQLPRLLAIRLRELGQTARHTLDLSAGNQTSDRDIASLADDEDAIVITKDADFLDSHLLSGSPSRLLLISPETFLTTNSSACSNVTSIKSPPPLQRVAY